MVITFATAGEAAIRLGEWRDMNDASKALPAGAYTTLRTYGGDRILRMEDHARRLRSSAEPPVEVALLPDERVRLAVAGALKSTRYPESRVRITFAPPRLFVSVEPFTPLPATLYTEGVACATVRLRRENPQAKSTGFLEAAVHAAAALPAGAHEGLMVADEDDAILEGLSSNVFFVVKGALLTEQARVLHGVTRSLVLEQAAELLPRGPRAAGLADLPAASECFLTSVSREILPVVRIDGSPVGTGSPGPVTRELMQRFAAFAQRAAETIG